jgi:signal transduction histidine kinase/CheY-like chemotaxis protein
MSGQWSGMTLSSSMFMSREQAQPEAPAMGDATHAALQAEIASLKAQLSDKSAEISRLRAALPSDNERRLQTIVDRMPGAVAYWDASLTLRYCNDYLNRHWAHKAQPLVGQHMTALLGGRGLERTMAHVHEVLAGRESSGEHVERNGTNAHVSYSPHIEDGVVKGFIVLAMDVSELKAARFAAEQANRAKSDFLASMSHEIRTPLHAVLGFAQVGALQFKQDEAGAHFRHILTAGQLLLGLINDILDFSKIEAGKLSLMPTDMMVAECVERAVDLVREQADRKGLRLHVTRHPDTPSRWLGDVVRIEQILLNLLSNAVKFTDQGEVRLDVWADQAGLHFAVQDTGPGMSAPVQSRLFKPFEQGDASSTRRVGGTGLGLSISKRLVDMMGGQIAVTSTPGQGSRFEVCLPLAVMAPPKPPARLISDVDWLACGLQGVRVLVAEDHHVNQLLLEQFLSNVGAVMHCVDNGVEAVEAVRYAGPGAFDIMLCDIEMPLMDGYQATQAIHQIDPTLPIVGLTAHAFDDARARGLSVGMSDYIIKPFVYEDLMQVMARHARASVSAPSTN